MGDENRKELIAEFSTYAHHFYQRCGTNICLAAKNIGMQGMPPLPLEVDLTRADARNTETIKIQPGQVVKFVSYHCTLDIFLSCGLFHIIGFESGGPIQRPICTRCCCVLDRPGKDSDHTDTQGRLRKIGGDWCIWLPRFARWVHKSQGNDDSRDRL